MSNKRWISSWKLITVLNRLYFNYINVPLDYLVDITLNKYKNKPILIICRLEEEQK